MFCAEILLAKIWEPRGAGMVHPQEALSTTLGCRGATVMSPSYLDLPNLREGAAWQMRPFRMAKANLPKLRGQKEISKSRRIFWKIESPGGPRSGHWAMGITKVDAGCLRAPAVRMDVRY